MALAPSDIVNCTLASGLLIGINNKIKFWVAPEVNYSKKKLLSLRASQTDRQND